MTSPKTSKVYKPFLELKDLPKLKLKVSKFKKSRLGRKFNGKHND